MADFPAVSIDIEESIYLVAENTFSRRTISELSVSPYAPGARMTGPRARLWATDLTTGKLTPAEVQAWEAMIDRLNGGAVGLRLYDPARQLPLGKAAGIWRGGSLGGGYKIDSVYPIDDIFSIEGGSPYGWLDQSAPRGATAVRMRGLVPSETVLMPGDLFELGGNLYAVSSRVLSDATGKATVPFSFALWKGEPAGALVNFVRPRGRFVLAQPDSGYARRQRSWGDVPLQAFEIPVVR